MTFDPEKLAYKDLVDRFWAVHDPTQVNRQGPDVGDQYRTVIFTHSPEQIEAATQSKEEAQQRFRKPIVTTVEAATGFWPAEEYHQCYLQKRRESGGLLATLLGR
ncbi:hypothetical protein BH10ACT11_BH10ACT11_01650 [soil metagenome]